MSNMHSCTMQGHKHHIDVSQVTQWVRGFLSYLDSMLHLRIFVVEDTKAKWFLWYYFNKHQVSTLQ